jgi:hypothetical protein
MTTPLDILLTIEAARALGIDAKSATDAVFSEQFRPEVRWIYANIPGSLSEYRPGVRVEVPEGERWILDWFQARGIAPEGGPGGGTADYWLSVSIRDMPSGDVPDSSLPMGEFQNPDVRHAFAHMPVSVLPNPSRGITQEYEGFRVFVGVNKQADPPNDNYYSMAGPLILYPRTKLFLQSDQTDPPAWPDDAELQIRGRYMAVPEHLVNYALARRSTYDRPPTGTLSPGAGVWSTSDFGEFF